MLWFETSYEMFIVTHTTSFVLLTKHLDILFVASDFKWEGIRLLLLPTRDEYLLHLPVYWFNSSQHLHVYIYKHICGICLVSP